MYLGLEIYFFADVASYDETAVVSLLGRGVGAGTALSQASDLREDPALEPEGNLAATPGLILC